MRIVVLASLLLFGCAIMLSILLDFRKAQVGGTSQRIKQRMNAMLSWIDRLADFFARHGYFFRRKALTLQGDGVCMESCRVVSALS